MGGCSPFVAPRRPLTRDLDIPEEHDNASSSLFLERKRADGRHGLTVPRGESGLSMGIPAGAQGKSISTGNRAGLGARS